ncbi:hypothetical protein ANHYDRO_00086 [Anaerococcus hydrogenalis DSM 7454]|uniref:Uncharacterized protein n=1 Tax=Anaerococcus hydrogenalis DSM 7454 TaxID=561177 RepID=B6W6A6_9FIRM|nr:hypothetical protein ANHYDRO_00086 [Anaerococcus hydrogenalis DSM 7454]KXA48608.1 hypothetical protein HMPREF1881_01840 [Streptococcus agalactiae]
MKKINTDRCYAIESNNSVVFFLCSKLGGQNGKDKKPHLKQFNI